MTGEKLNNIKVNLILTKYVFYDKTQDFQNN